MKIQLKRSNQVEADGSAKKPTAAQMEYGELAVNYNADDPAIFLEDSDGTIVRIAGEGALGNFSGDYNDLINTPTIGDATITLKLNGEDVGFFTTNQEGDDEIDFVLDSSEVIISDTAPDTSAYDPGTLWWNSADGNLYVLYQDDDSTQWVQAIASAGGGTQNLQEVTDEGSITTNKIQAAGYRIDQLLDLPETTP